MSDIKKPRFDLTQIGEADRHNLAVTFLEAVQRFYEDPANLERFEKWKQEKNRCVGSSKEIQY